MDVTEVNKRISHLENKLDELKNLKASYESTISKKELLDKYDFDCDGVISCIDIYIPVMAVLGTLKGNALYNEAKQTYNGKSLDLTGDGNVMVNDYINAANVMLKEINGIYDVNFWVPKITANDGTVLEYGDIITNLYTQKGKVLPTLQELKDFVNQYNS
jgi:hypothetical protein